VGQLIHLRIPSRQPGSHGFDDALNAVDHEEAGCLMDVLGEVADENADVHEQVVSRIEAARLRRLVAGLPPLHARVLRWRFGVSEGGEELSVRQVARKLNMSVGAAWKLEQQALEMLREEYADEVAA
jgi:DNA-directed RNA polymerase sigma subunit (sigma70/sigma32)